MKKITIGILAHVDSGKTTLTESMLFLSGAIKKAGRVDHKNTFLDTNVLEKERGITIFSHQAKMNISGDEITILDTPGHVDFSAEAERVLSVLDAGILVISAQDGVKSHTQTLWRLLSRYNIPTFVFVNKMDIAVREKAEILDEIEKKLGENFIDFDTDDFLTEKKEELSLCSEALLDEYLEDKNFSHGAIVSAIGQRQLFPCFFGSALKHEGVERLILSMLTYTKPKVYFNNFAAKVFKISDDGKGARLTHLKITGGSLNVRDELFGKGENEWREKVTQIRFYSGDKFEAKDRAEAGDVCAVLGLSKTYQGEGLGEEIDSFRPILEPVLYYKIVLPEDTNIKTALAKLSSLSEEEPELMIRYSEEKQEIEAMLMGEIQLEVIKRIVKEKYDLDISFGDGTICYKETIKEKVLGIGHFEPLRHYAEVHLLLEPLSYGSGLVFSTNVKSDDLEQNWQRLILTHLKEKEHKGVLTGSPLCDMKITLVAGKSHKKHTEGGDFRQATYRAVRQGLMKAESVLLEPRYDFSITLPQAYLGRALNDLSNMGARFSSPIINSDEAQISGNASVKAMQGYQKELTSYTKGAGRIFCISSGYEPCQNSEKIIEEIGYNPERDVENTADSVFCEHGAGFNVKWSDVDSFAHIEKCFESEEEILLKRAENEKRASEFTKKIQSDSELMEIFERTYGKVTTKLYKAPREIRQKDEIPQRYVKKKKTKAYDKEYLLVDGYNIIFAVDYLNELAKENLEGARAKLCDILCNYQGFTGCEVILVFDAYKVKGNPGEVSKIQNINVVYTKEAETADMYIEKVTRKISQNARVVVATSDSLEQLIILGAGALRMSADDFKKEIEDVEKAIRELIN